MKRTPFSRELPSQRSKGVLHSFSSRPPWMVLNKRRWVPPDLAPLLPSSPGNFLFLPRRVIAFHSSPWSNPLYRPWFGALTSLLRPKFPFFYFRDLVSSLFPPNLSIVVSLSLSRCSDVPGDLQSRWHAHVCFSCLLPNSHRLISASLPGHPFLPLFSFF